MRLARSYEELRGPDIEGFVRVHPRPGGGRRGAARGGLRGGGRRRGPAADDPRGEGARVQGRDRRRRRAATRPARRRPTRSSSGPTGASASASSIRRRASASGVFDYEEVREAEKAEDDAERLRLYYVAMTRAIDRLIVSGAIDPERRRTARRRSAGCSTGSARAARSRRADGAGRARARRRALRSSRVDRCGARRVAAVRAELDDAEPGQLALFAELPTAPAPRGYRLPELVPLPRRRSTRCGASRTRRSRCSSAARTATTPSASPACARSAALAPGGGRA